MQVSFGANLIVDKDYAKKPPKRIDRGNLLKVKDEYADFIKNDRIVCALMPCDTVEISTSNEKDGYYLNVDFYEDGKEEPFKEYYCIGRGVDSQFRSSTLRMFTYYFIAQKSGLEQRLSEGMLKYIKRGIIEYASQIKSGKN